MNSEVNSVSDSPALLMNRPVPRVLFCWPKIPVEVEGWDPNRPPLGAGAEPAPNPNPDTGNNDKNQLRSTLPW